MISDKIVISGTGCALADYLYTGIKFNSTQFTSYHSRQPGDGGLCPGKLVFTEDLEVFSSKPYAEIFTDLTEGRNPNTVNIGGPGLVSLINTSQLLDPQEFKVCYYGGTGRDATAEYMFDLLTKTPLDISNYHKISEKFTPFTHVLSDPTYDNNHGERTFINNIGAAWDYTPDYLDDEFFKSDIVCFGGTALVPQIHDRLTELVTKAKYRGCLVVVNTVFDFRNEGKNPGMPWPLGNTIESLKHIDLLIMDCEEAIRISGCRTIDSAADFFARSEVASFIITNGTRNILAGSNGDLFSGKGRMELPVSQKVTETLKQNPALQGDTTGCGDNFAGGAIASLAWQLKTREKGDFDFMDTIAWATASGGFACFYVGGTYIELSPGEKHTKISELVEDYKRVHS
jgi:sugar/nucleoside kinase (ribokinase family)